MTFSDAVALIVIGLLYKQSQSARIKAEEMDAEERDHDAKHQLVIESGKLSPELEALHRQMVHAFIRERFQQWFSANSFLYSLGGALLTYLCGITPWPGLCLGAMVSSPRCWGYLIRWKTAIMFGFVAALALIFYLFGGWDWMRANPKAFSGLGLPLLFLLAAVRSGNKNSAA